jgi:hypothetical protein
MYDVLLRAGRENLSASNTALRSIMVGTALMAVRGIPGPLLLRRSLHAFDAHSLTSSSGYRKLYPGYERYLRAATNLFNLTLTSTIRKSDCSALSIHRFALTDASTTSTLHCMAGGGILRTNAWISMAVAPVRFAGELSVGGRRQPRRKHGLGSGGWL